MIYFYAGLGTAMLTGIMMLFEIGLALRGQSFFDSLNTTEIKSNRDMNSSSEKMFLMMLSRDQEFIGDGLSGQALCQQILCRIEGKDCRSGNSQSSLYNDLKEYSLPHLSSPPQGLWASACVLEDVKKMNDSDADNDEKNIINRLLILPSNSSINPNYRMFSCTISIRDIDARCSFEKGA